MYVFQICVQLITIIIVTKSVNCLNEQCWHRSLRKRGTCVYFGNCAREKLVVNNQVFPEICRGYQRRSYVVCCPNEEKSTIIKDDANIGVKAEQKCNEYTQLYQSLKGTPKSESGVVKRHADINFWYDHDYSDHHGETDEHWDPKKHHGHWEHHRNMDGHSEHHKNWEHHDKLDEHWNPSEHHGVMDEDWDWGPPEHEDGQWNYQTDYKEYDGNNSSDSEYPKYSFDNMFRWEEHDNYKTIDWGNDTSEDEDSSTMSPDLNITVDDDNRENFHVSVVGGEDAKWAQFPHTVGLGFGNSSAIIWGCGGTLINERFILTAAHCIANGQLGRVRYAQMGVLKLNPQDKIFNVRRTYLPKEYNPRFYYNDIALVELSSPVAFRKSIIPACLFVAKDNRDSFKDFTVNAVGWGRTGNGTLADILQTVDLQFFDDCKLKSIKIPKGVDDNTQICYGHETKEKDTCNGDSGGPLHFFDNVYKVIGITSFGQGACAVTGVPAVYTRVSQYVGWIESIVWKNL